MMKRYFLILISFLVVFSCESRHNNQNTATNTPPPKESAYVVLVSFDGFRYDYAQKYQLKNFLAMAKEGTSATAMLPSFPSKTFPNHYSIVTGMYPGHHGLVDNRFYDRQRDAYYSISDRPKVEDPYYYGGTPLWQLLEKQGIKTASYFFVGSETPIQGILPSYYYKYNEKIPNENRIERVVQWLNFPEKDRPKFISLYFSLVDTEGHRSGPNSPALEKTVKEADRLLGLLNEKLKAIPLPVTTIVISDHGMAEMDSQPEHLIFIDDKLASIKDKIRYVNNGMHTHIYLKDSTNKAQIAQYLNQSFKNTPVQVYKKEDTPEQWHYRNSPRIGDILLVTQAPYYMLPSANHPVAKKTQSWGTHGYDPYTTPDMGAIFYATGPRIKVNYQIPAFENVNVYPFICYLLGVEPPSTIDGKASVLQPILKK